LFAIALFPPLWRKFIEPYLEDIDQNDASEGEQKIAREMNKIAGYQTI
jgi:aspartate-semialdehyde dehydrogenase